MKFLSTLFHPAPDTPAPPVVVDASDNPDWSEWKLTIYPSENKVGEYYAYLSHPRLSYQEDFAGTKDSILRRAALYKIGKEQRWHEEDERKAKIEEQKAKGPEVMYL